MSAVQSAGAASPTPMLSEKVSGRDALVDGGPIAVVVVPLENPPSCDEAALPHPVTTMAVAATPNKTLLDMQSRYIKSWESFLVGFAGLGSGRLLLSCREPGRGRRSSRRRARCQRRVGSGRLGPQERSPPLTCVSLGRALRVGIRHRPGSLPRRKARS